ncbi:hypothetical protein PtA15_18A219 [Puccinia triticina]|uniref:Uncharacterized protein n=1 Tax=Puccinia triticina TaxID=208348 RepID=A0ABY7D9Y2_9BASI|nr:uncharacterized protein PtA15_18A219 [Puccinia triticina]WAQ93161.1 hypothetical protein PtA15_18A219 [Puccinia triticina]WAR63139.1 hypothetical protein PtB15_18B221 [Puccinia triticina]
MMLARSSASQKPKASSYSAEEMMAFWSKQAKLNPKLTRPKDEFSKKEPSNQSQASRDQKFKSPQDSDVGPSVRSNYYPNTPQSMAKVPENHAMEQKQEEPSSPFPIPFSRRPPKITKELPASHWLKLNQPNQSQQPRKNYRGTSQKLQSVGMKSSNQSKIQM